MCTPQRKLSRKFGVHGIPRLVLLDGETGRVITREGFDRLSEDSTGSGFPWRRKPLHEVVKGTLLQAVEGSDVPQEVDANSALEGQSVIGFYFSAHWVSSSVSTCYSNYITCRTTGSARVTD